MVDHHDAVSTTTPPTTPTSAVRVARIGGTIAELAAAAISAHTLYHLGGQLGLGPTTAWLLPAALDTYAFTALAVGYNLPADHPGQRSVLRNARLAFAMTLGANALDHFLQKAGQLVDPTVRDLLLVTVATLPPLVAAGYYRLPLVVERLLNLQSVLGDQRQQPFDNQDNHLHASKARLAHDSASGPTTDQQSVDWTPDTVVPVGGRPDWFDIGQEVFDGLVCNLGRRPTGREFQSALADQIRHLIAGGRLPAGTRPPSVTTAKRVRATLEARRPTQTRGQAIVPTDP